MAYDAVLAERVCDHFAPRGAELSTRKMFGGLCVMLRGHMCAGVVGSSLMLGLGKEGAAAALGEPHVREMDFTGKPLSGMVYVDAPAFADDHALGAWLDRASAFTDSLPRKG